MGVYYQDFDTVHPTGLKEIRDLRWPQFPRSGVDNAHTTVLWLGKERT